MPRMYRAWLSTGFITTQAGLGFCQLSLTAAIDSGPILSLLDYKVSER